MQRFRITKFKGSGVQGYRGAGGQSLKYAWNQNILLEILIKYGLIYLIKSVILLWNNVSLNTITMGNFKNLIVWQKAKDLAVSIYRLTKEGEISKDFGLRDQIRRSAVSVPSNIAEGDDLETNKQAIRYFYIAKGSVSELETQLLIAREIGYLKDNADPLISECKLISVMLLKLISLRRTE